MRVFIRNIFYIKNYILIIKCGYKALTKRTSTKKIIIMRRFAWTQKISCILRYNFITSLIKAKFNAIYSKNFRIFIDTREELNHIVLLLICSKRKSLWH